MIQRPGQDEILVGVPSAGTLLDPQHHRILQSVFGGLLASGHEERHDGQSVVVWHVEGRDPLPVTDPSAAPTIAGLRRGIQRATEAAEELRARLDASPRAHDIDVGPVTGGVLRTGAVGDRPHRIARAKAEEIEQVLSRGAKAVNYALSNPRLFSDDRGVCLACWGFLPPSVIVEAPRVPVVPSSAPQLVPPPPEAPATIDVQPARVSPVPEQAPADPPAVPGDPPPAEPVAPPARPWPRWLWAVLALVLLLLGIPLVWLLFPGLAHVTRLDPALVAPSAGTLPEQASDDDRRRGTVDVELPPLPEPRVLQWLEPTKGDEP